MNSPSRTFVRSRGGGDARLEYFTDIRPINPSPSVPPTKGYTLDSQAPVPHKLKSQVGQYTAADIDKSQPTLPQDTAPPGFNPLHRTVKIPPSAWQWEPLTFGRILPVSGC